MRKIRFIIVSLLTLHAGTLFSQGTSDGTYYAAPSAASVQSFINSPVSLSTGIPDITIPFFSLPTHNAEIGLNVGISYHPNNAGKKSRASDVGLGWSLYGSGCMISRETGPNNNPTDGYYYTFLGRSGKFLLKTDSQGEKYIVPLTQSRLNITYHEASNSFKIIDESGNSFFFDRPDKSYYSPNQATEISYASAYYVSKIKDIYQNDVLLFDYIEDNYILPGGGLNKTKSLKLSKVTSPDFGSIEFTYNLDTNLRKKLSDVFQLQRVELKNKAGKIIQKYTLQSDMGSFTYYDPTISSCGPEQVESGFYDKRVLYSIQKYGTSTQFEQTSFEYNTEPFAENYWTYFKCHCLGESENPKYLGAGLLKTITYPTGGQTRYEFEPNQYIVKKTHIYDPFPAVPSSSQYVPPYSLNDRDAQVLEDVGTYTFDTHNGDTYNFSLTSNPDDSQGASYLMFCFNVDVYYTDSPVWGPGIQPSLDVKLTSGITDAAGNEKFMPGTNTFKVTGTGGGGTVTIKRIRYKSLPIAGYTTGNGVRIKKIEFLENNTPVDSETRYYSYQQFGNNTLTSGFFKDFDDAGTVVYKNVKETVGANKGYAKYYFKTLEDNADNVDADGNFPGNISHYNILRNGLLDKKEVFDAANALVAKEENTFELYPVGSFYQANEANTGVLLIRNSIIKKQTNTSTSFAGADAISTSTESTREQFDLNISGKKTVTPEGETVEEKYTYTKGGANRLWAAGIKDKLIITETKKNGVTVGKTEARYDDISNFYPTSQVSYLPDDLSQSVNNTAYDLYDDKGNLVQYRTFPNTGSEGFPVTVIWGYNKTIPIAKIEGAKFADIPASLIAAIVNASNEDANAVPGTEEAKENALISALNTFRNDASLRNFIITAYTYDPMIGMTTMITPGGLTEKYKYDSFNRLEKVIDGNGVTVKEYKYNYKN